MTLAERLATALRTVDPAAASRLEAAVLVGGADAQRLLELRSAMVSTRNAWEHVGDAELVASARRTVAAAKRLAIDL